MTLERVPPRPQMRGQQTSRCAVLSATHRACPRRQRPRGRWGRGASGGTQDMCAGATQQAPRGAWQPSPPVTARQPTDAGRRPGGGAFSGKGAARRPPPSRGRGRVALGQPSSGRTRSRLSEGSWLATGAGAAAVGAGRWAVSLAAGRSPRLKGHASLRAAQSVTGSSVKRGNPLGPRARFRGHDLQQETWLCRLLRTPCSALLTGAGCGGERQTRGERFQSTRSTENSIRAVQAQPGLAGHRRAPPRLQVERAWPSQAPQQRCDEGVTGLPGEC